MRPHPRKSVPTTLTREDKLRESRAAAQTLRTAAPSATLVQVQLEFVSAQQPLPGPQSFFLYPAARAAFAYPCPLWDCDGIFDLGAEAEKTLRGENATVSGTTECVGMRAHRGSERHACGLLVSYTITTQYQAVRKA